VLCGEKAAGDERCGGRGGECGNSKEEVKGGEVWGRKRVQRAERKKRS
jgi:hypothetical protein